MDAELFSDYPRKSYLQLLAEFLLRECGPTHDENRVDWCQIELDIGVTLPSSFKKTSDLIPSPSLGHGLYWKSHEPAGSQDRLDRTSLEHRSRLYVGLSNIPLYPMVPGYLIFASGPSRIDLSFRVERDESGHLQCAPEVVLLELNCDEVERTRVETDEFLYRCITNKPPLNGSMSGYLAPEIFGETDIPIFRWPATS